MNQDIGWKLKPEFELQPHQVVTYTAYQRGPRYGDWSDAGTGKSLPALCSVLNRMARRLTVHLGDDRFYARECKNAVIFTPASTVFAWMNDTISMFENTGDVEIVSYQGSTSKRAKIREYVESVTHPVILIVSWGFLSSRRTLTDIAWIQTIVDPHFFILDEAQYINGDSSTRTKKVTEWIQSEYHQVYMLTATPLEDGAHKMWPLFNLLFTSPVTGRNTRYPAGQAEFYKRHFEYAIDQFGEERLSPIRHNIDDFESNMYRLALKHTRANVMQNREEPVFSVRTFTMFPDQAALYWYLVDTLSMELGDTWVNLEDPRQRMLRERQIASDPAVLGFDSGHARFHALLDVLKEIGKTKVIVLTEWRWSWQFLMSELPKHGYSVTGILGGMPGARRAEALQKFNEDPDCLVFVGSRDAMGVGLNLQAANVMVDYELGWSGSKSVQGHGRIDRLTQTKQCIYFTLCAEDTIDLYVFNKLRKKLKIADGLFEKVVELSKRAQKRGKALSEAEKKKIYDILNKEETCQVT